MPLEDDRIDEIARLMDAWKWTMSKAFELMIKWGISQDDMVALVHQAVPRALKYEPLRVALARVELAQLDRLIAAGKRIGATKAIAEAEQARKGILASVGEPGPVN